MQKEVIEEVEVETKSTAQKIFTWIFGNLKFLFVPASRISSFNFLAFFAAARPLADFGLASNKPASAGVLFKNVTAISIKPGE